MITETNMPSDVKASGFELPSGYRRVFELGLTQLTPWYMLTDETELYGVHSGLNKRYPSRLVLPFARRQDNDNVACFVVQSDRHAHGQIIVVHDFASPGWEIDAVLTGFWDWFRLAIADMIEWSE